MSETKMTPQDIAQGIKMTADSVRLLPKYRGKPDDQIKKDLLVDAGWAFSRRKDKWIKGEKEINPYATLEQVILDITV